MVETSINPSELHLKRELSTLQKARFLRDPETSVSWRSCLNSGSVTANSSLHPGNVIAGDPGIVDNSSQLQGAPPKSKRVGKKVHLYNWSSHPRESSDSWSKPDEENKQGLIQDIVNSNPEPFPIFKFSNSGHQSKVNGRKFRRVVSSRRRSVNCSSISKVDCQSNSLETTYSADESEDNEVVNSGKLIHLKNKPIQKDTSGCTSPLLSGSACGDFSSSSKFMKFAKIDWSSCTSVSHRSQSIPANQITNCLGSSEDVISSSFSGHEMEQIYQQGCGIPCYWLKRKAASSRSSCSSLLDARSKKFSTILYGSQTSYTKRSLTSLKECPPRSSQGSPLLINSFGGHDSSTEAENHELSSYLHELNLEAKSRLDGKRWLSHGSQNTADWASVRNAIPETEEKSSLSRKYRPRFFSEIVGQNIVVQSLQNAIFMGKVAPAYLFQGQRGTGKSSTARVFAAALGCLSTEQNRPCGLCDECISFFSGVGLNVTEVDGKNKKDVGLLKRLLKNLHCTSQYKVFVINDCHMLSSTSLLAFIKYLEQPLPYAILIFISNDSKLIPRSIVSRCQKYNFAKIKDTDIVNRLSKICTAEKVDFDIDAIDLIASHSDGSLTNAEAMLNQLNILGRRITTSLVNEIIGLVSEEKLFDLLETALSSDTIETLKRCRELMESGADPETLMSQLAGLVVDIITGAHQLSNLQSSQRTAAGHSLSEVELGRLQNALKILSDTEKQLSHSNERSTLFTTALLQLASSNYVDHTHSSSNHSKDAEEQFAGPLELKLTSHPQNSSAAALTIQETSRTSISRAATRQSGLIEHSSHKISTSSKHASDKLNRNSFSVERNIVDASHKGAVAGNRTFRCISPDNLEIIWQKCIKRCHSESLRKLLASHGKLVSITAVEGALIAYIAFGNDIVKSRAERFLSSITNSIEIVLKHDVEVRTGIVPENCLKIFNSVPNPPMIGKVRSARMYSTSENDQRTGLNNLPISMDYSMDNPETIQKKKLDEGNSTSEDEIPEGAYCGRMERAWLQSAEKGEQADMLRHSRPEKMLEMPQDGQSKGLQKSPLVQSVSLKHWAQELNNEIEEIESDGSHLPGNAALQKNIEWYNCPISPSLLHTDTLRRNFDKDNMGYESGPVRTGFCCWSRSKSRKTKVKQGSHTGRHKASCLQCYTQPYP